MVRSNLIRIIFAVFCGLVAQFHGSSANAQNVYLYQGTVWSEGSGACTENGYCAYFWGTWGDNFDTLQLFDPNGNRLWMSPGGCGDFCPFGVLNFQSDGNLVAYEGWGNLVNWATNTYAGNTATGLPAGVVVLDESGNFYINDVNWNFLGCLYCNGWSYWGAQ